MTVSAARAAEYERVLARAAAWAARESGVVGALLVGSFARDEATVDSDVDVVILTDRADAYREATDWISEATGENAPVVRSQYWGPLLERRVRLASGLEVEFGFVAPSWAEIDPLDEGTAGVVARGVRTLYDPNGVVSRLAIAVSRRGPA